MPIPSWILALEALSSEDIASAAENVDTNPSPAQKEAGNYRKGHITWNGLDIAIETPKGGTRKAHDGSWKVENLPAHYGYIKRTEGADGDHVDVYIGDAPESDSVFVIDQLTLETGKFDETKSMLGFKSLADAKAAYLGGFSDGKGKDRIQAITPTTVAAFKRWIDSNYHHKAFSTMNINEDRYNIRVKAVAGLYSDETPATFETRITVSAVSRKHALNKALVAAKGIPFIADRLRNDIRVDYDCIIEQYTPFSKAGTINEAASRANILNARQYITRIKNTSKKKYAENLLDLVGAGTDWDEACREVDRGDLSGLGAQSVRIELRKILGIVTESIAFKSSEPTTKAVNALESMTIGSVQAPSSCLRCKSAEWNDTGYCQYHYNKEFAKKSKKVDMKELERLLMRNESWENADRKQQAQNADHGPNCECSKCAPALCAKCDHPAVDGSRYCGKCKPTMKKESMWESVLESYIPGDIGFDLDDEHADCYHEIASKAKWAPYGRTLSKKEQAEFDKEVNALQMKRYGTTGGRSSIVYTEGRELQSVAKEYRRNEQNNEHTKNILLLATTFGTEDEVEIAKNAVKVLNRDGGWDSSNREHERIRTQLNKISSKYSPKLRGVTEAIAPSTAYKLVNATTGKIIAAGSAKDMHKLRKKQLPGTHYVALTNNKVGQTFPTLGESKLNEAAKMIEKAKKLGILKEAVSGPTRMQLQNYLDNLRNSNVHPASVRELINQVEKAFNVKNIVLTPGGFTIVYFQHADGRTGDYSGLGESTEPMWKEFLEEKFSKEDIRNQMQAFYRYLMKTADDESRENLLKIVGLAYHAKNIKLTNSGMDIASFDLTEAKDEGVIPSEVDTNVDMKILRKTLDTVANDPKYKDLKLAGKDFADDVEAAYRKDHEDDPHDTAAVRLGDPIKESMVESILAEAVPFRQTAAAAEALVKKFASNEKHNKHTDNALLLAKAYGDASEVKLVNLALAVRAAGDYDGPGGPAKEHADNEKEWRAAVEKIHSKYLPALKALPAYKKLFRESKLNAGQVTPDEMEEINHIHKLGRSFYGKAYDLVSLQPWFKKATPDEQRKEVNTGFRILVTKHPDEKKLIAWAKDAGTLRENILNEKFYYDFRPGDKGIYKGKPIEIVVPTYNLPPFHRMVRYVKDYVTAVFVVKTNELEGLEEGTAMVGDIIEATAAPKYKAPTLKDKLKPQLDREKAELAIKQNHALSVAGEKDFIEKQRQAAVKAQQKAK